MSLDPASAAARKPNTPPSRALLLGGLGLIPFAASLLGIAIGPEAMRAQAEMALMVYGAVILSFLGGIWWGMAASNTDYEDRQDIYYLLSVIPSIVGWGAVLIGGAVGFMVLAIGFALVLGVDNRLRAMRLFPGWWMQLRTPLSLGVITILGAAAFIV